MQKDVKVEETIEKTVDISFDGKQFLIRIPKEISDFLELKKGKKFKFIIKVAPPDKPKEKSDMKFQILK